MAAEDKRLDVPKELLEAARKKVGRRIRAFLREAGVVRPHDPVVNRDVLSIAAGGWGPLIAKELIKLGFTEKPTGNPRQRAVGVAAWEALDAASAGVSISKADLIRAGLRLLVEQGLPEIDDEELERLLEVEDERRRFGQGDS